MQTPWEYRYANRTQRMGSSVIRELLNRDGARPIGHLLTEFGEQTLGSDDVQAHSCAHPECHLPAAATQRARLRGGCDSHLPVFFSFPSLTAGESCCITLAGGAQPLPGHLRGGIAVGTGRGVRAMERVSQHCSKEVGQCRVSFSAQGS